MSLRYSPLILLLTFVFRCETDKQGWLKVRAPISAPGKYEIYRVFGKNTLTFISQQSGLYNKSVKLVTGSYLVLSDCSANVVTVLPNKETVLIAHQINFLAPTKVNHSDIFNIQCLRHSKTHAPQQIKNRFSLTVISGEERELLVGLSSIKFDLSDSVSSEPKIFVQKLSAVSVIQPKHNKNNPNYFVSPQNNNSATTQGQILGKRQFLIPGKYTVSVNNTSKVIDLKPGDSLDIFTSSLNFITDPKVDLDSFRKIRAKPYLLAINNIASFKPNEVYVFLPGKLNFKLPDNTESETITLVENQKRVIFLRSITIFQKCGPWEWECLGNKNITIYKKNSSRPVALSTTDVPVLLTLKDVYVEMESSKGIKVKVQNKPFIELGTGKLNILSKPSFNSQIVTDVIRIEGDNVQSFGFSYDLQRNKETAVFLIEGLYKLANYNSNKSSQKDTSQIQLSNFLQFHIKSNFEKTLQVLYYSPPQSRGERKNIPRTKNKNLNARLSNLIY